MALKPSSISQEIRMPNGLVDFHNGPQLNARLRFNEDSKFRKTKQLETESSVDYYSCRQDIYVIKRSNTQSRVLVRCCPQMIIVGGEGRCKSKRKDGQGALGAPPANVWPGLLPKINDRLLNCRAARRATGGPHVKRPAVGPQAKRKAARRHEAHPTRYRYRLFI
jgi:hypothetical protein